MFFLIDEKGSDLHKRLYVLKRIFYLRFFPVGLNDSFGRLSIITAVFVNVVGHKDTKTVGQFCYGYFCGFLFYFNLKAIDFFLAAFSILDESDRIDFNNVTFIAADAKILL